MQERWLQMREQHLYQTKVKKSRASSRSIQTGRLQLTDGSHDLRLQAKLVLEPTGKVANAAIAISGHVRDLSNVIEHLTTGE